MACACDSSAVCQHHASGGLLALILFTAAGCAVAAGWDRIVRRFL